MKLNEIKDNDGAVHSRKIVGRGIGSGKGKTSGKGHKGQKARGSGKVRLGFEGGQNPIYRRMPKRGFTNIFKKEYFLLSTNMLLKLIETNKISANEVIDYDYLKQQRVIKGSYDGLKLLYKGDVNQSFKLKLSAVSEKAKATVEQNSGSIEIVEKKKFINKAKVY